MHPGTHRDARDPRDRRFRPAALRLPARVDLSKFCGPAFTQRRIQSCSANAIAGALMMIANREGSPIVRPSRLFMYYNARAALGEARTDCGTTMRSAIKAVARYGACPETHWPYVVANVLKKPPRACYDRADIRTIVYERIRQNINHMRACLAQGQPFVFGIEAYVEPFSRAAKTAFLELPKPGTQPMGGHALLAVGYDDRKGAILARNSLGPSYGRNGFFWVDERYLIDPKLSYDFWCIRSLAQTR